MRTLEQREILAQAAAIKSAERKALKAKWSPHVPITLEKDRRERDPKFLQWLRRLPCAAAAVGTCDGPIEAAHVRYSSAPSDRRNPGMQCKPDDRHAVPLCFGHHRGGRGSQHSMNEGRFWSFICIDPATLYVELGECFDNDGDGAAVIRQFTEQASLKRTFTGTVVKRGEG